MKSKKKKIAENGEKRKSVYACPLREGNNDDDG